MGYKILGLVLIVIGAVVTLLAVLAGFGGAGIFSILRIFLLGFVLASWGLRLAARNR